MALFVSGSVLDLTILDLYQLAQVLVLFLQGVVFLRNCFLLLFGLHYSVFVMLLLLAQLRDLLLEIAHELVLLGNHVCNGFLTIEKHIVLF